MPARRLASIEIDDDELPAILWQDKVFVFRNPILGVDSFVGCTANEPAEPLHLPMFDTRELSGFERYDLLNFLYRLNAETGLGFVFIRSTVGKNCYHIIGLQPTAAKSILFLAAGISDYLDMRHLAIGLERGFWTMRISTKGVGSFPPQLVECVPPGKGHTANAGIVRLLLLIYPDNPTLHSIKKDRYNELSFRMYYA